MAGVKIDKDYAVEHSLFLSEWKAQMTETLLRMHPDWDEGLIEETLNEEIRNKIMVPMVELDNNFTGERRQSNLLSVFDWSLKRKPIVAGNGTFYKNQHEAVNPIADMLDGFLSERKAIKRRMFDVDDPNSDLYKDLDRG
jgi:hypothetical protein